MISHDRRRAPRLLCSEIVALSIETGKHRGKRLTAVVEDVSESGACLSLDCVLDLEPGVQTVVSSKHLRIRGQIKHRHTDNIGPHIGIEFGALLSKQEVIDWPEHVLDPTTLNQ